MVKNLTPESDFLNPEEIKKGLKTKIIGKKVYFFNKIPSTNLYAKNLIKKNIEEGTIVIADVQTSGRGRKNRYWHSPYGGVWFSVILYPDLSPESGMLITMAASISVAQAIKDVTGINTEIKWPNDLLLRKKKVCGILTEIDSDLYKINYAIVGIGINVNNELDDELKKIAFSLKQEIGSKVSRIKILKSILENLDKNYNKLIKKDIDYIKKTWFSFSKIIGRKIQIKDDNIVRKGIVKEIDDDGYLILRTRFGDIRITSGDVKYL